MSLHEGASKEDLRSSKVDFGSFLEDMAMVVTYVPGDETGAMQFAKSASSSSVPSEPLPTAPSLTYNPWPTRSRENSSAQAFNLGAAAIVSSRRNTPTSSSLFVDMEELQNALAGNLNFTPDPEPLSVAPPVQMPVVPVPIPSTVVQVTAPKTTTRVSRAAGHSDAPKPIGYVRPSSPSIHPHSAPTSTETTPSSSNPSSESSSPAHMSIQAPEPQLPTSRPSTPPLGGDSTPSAADASVRPRSRQHSPAPIPATRPGFASFEELLLEPNASLLKALCTCLQITEATKTCASVVMIFEAKQRTLGMIQSMIEFEVSLQKTAATLFRNNSLTTHLMTCYTKLVGLPFLKSVVGPVILDAFAKIDAGDVTYEIDPAKIGTEDIKANIADLKRLVHSFFDRILNSRALMPKNFMEICGTLQNSTIERFPESRYFVIGGFLFLRYICPAVVAPDGYKLIESTISDKQRRMLVLVSKILQTIANERTFGDKEEYMMCMNALVNEYQGIVQYFFNQLAKPTMPGTPENIPAVIITPEDYLLALKQIHGQVKGTKTKLIAHTLIQSDPKLLQAIENIETIPLMQ